ncbi:unnamed protein product [Anisakis simplex]|uniref:Uncharacterized protein n=1 Tax=Anisakis simplex TaxID=6269 RepID=A0A0M3JS12_ANISI|nr:unnamed protein product [Anisakis simplex]
MLSHLVPTQICSTQNFLLKTSVRLVSRKYIRPHPRPYKRRWFEAAVAPVMPASRRLCPSVVEMKQQFERERNEVIFISYLYFVIMISIHQLLRLKGLEFRNYGNRIMQKAFEATPLETLNVLLIGSNCMLFGKNMQSLRTIVQECDKLAWIEPLAVVYDSKILSMQEVRELCMKKTFEENRSEAVNTFDGILMETSQLLDLPKTLTQQTLATLDGQFGELTGILEKIYSSEHTSTKK